MADSMLATAAACLSPQFTLPQAGSSGRTNLAAPMQKTNCRIGSQNRRNCNLAAQSQRNGRVGHAYGKLLQISYCTSEKRALSSSEEEDEDEEEEEDDEEVEEVKGEEWEVAPLRSSEGIDVYVASIPLRSPKSVQWILRAADEADFGVNLQHFMTLIRPAGDGNDDSCTVLDFQPRNPEDPMAAVSVLMGRTIPGVLLERTLPKLPRRRCWWVGQMKAGLDVQDAIKFHREYDSELSLGINDCRHHTLDLVEHLTGERMPYIEQVRFIQEKKVQQLKKQATVTESEGEADDVAAAAAADDDDDAEYGNPVLSLFSNFFRDLVDVLTGKETMSGEEEQVQSATKSDSITDQALQNEDSSLAPAMLEEEEAELEVSAKVPK